MTIIGLIFIAIGVACFFGYRSNQKKTGEVLLTQTSKIKDLIEQAQAVSTELGAGYFQEYAELKGDIECSDPLLSPFSQTPCVYYSASIDCISIEEYWSTDSEGEEFLSTEEHRDTLFSESDSQLFTLNDQSGTITIDPNLGMSDTESFSESYHPEDPCIYEDGIELGEEFIKWTNSFRLDPTKIEEYRLSETYFPASGNIYALGTVIEKENSLALSKPKEKGQKYLVSSKTEEEILESQNQNAKILKWVSIGFGVLGLILTIMGGL